MASFSTVVSRGCALSHCGNDYKADDVWTTVCSSVMCGVKSGLKGERRLIFWKPPRWSQISPFMQCLHYFIIFMNLKRMNFEFEFLKRVFSYYFKKIK